MDSPSLLPLEAVPWRGAAALVGRAVRRFWPVIAVVVAAFTGAGVAAATWLPRSYGGEARLLVRKGTSTMAAVTDPRRAIVPGFDQPAQAAVELALSRSALQFIVREARLVEQWSAHRPPLLAKVDAVRERLFGAVSAADRADAIVGMLQGRLRVSLAEEVVRVRVTWWDAGAVEAILSQAIAAFLAERRRLDIESLEASRGILARSVVERREEVARKVLDFQNARAMAMGKVAAKTPVPKGITPKVGALRDRFLERRAYREELERQRRQKQAALELALAQQAETLGPGHPDRIATEKALIGVGAIEDESITRARREEGTALDEYLAGGGSPDVFEDASTAVDANLDPASALRPDDDPGVIRARAELRLAVDSYQDLSMRLENARLELETALAALPFRYMVTQPPERPRKPDSPQVPMVVGGAMTAGVLAGVLLAIALAVRAERPRPATALVWTDDDAEPPTLGRAA